jgi:hypothetical protein
MTIEGKSVSMRGALPTAARSWPLSGRGLLGGLREDAGTGVAGSGDGGGGARGRVHQRFLMKIFQASSYSRWVLP